MIAAASMADRAPVVALWQTAGLTRPGNDPLADFAQALEAPGSTILVQGA